MNSDRSFSVSGGFLIISALLLLVVPLPWLIASLVAAAFHELCHWIMLRVLCGKGHPVRIGLSGAYMQAQNLSRGRELLCSLAGPVGGLSLLLVGRWMPRTTFCAVAQSIYNLLPIYPLDGGRALQSLLSIGLTPPMAEKAMVVVSFVCKIGLFILAFYACLVLKFGLLPLLLALLLLIRTK